MIFKNAARALKRGKPGHKSFWPDLYEFEGPAWDQKLDKVVRENLAMWLPLELLDMIWQLGALRSYSKPTTWTPRQGSTLMP